MVDVAEGGWATLDLENSPAPSPLEEEDDPTTTEGGPPADDKVAEVEDEEEEADPVCNVGLVPVSLIFRIQRGQNHLPRGLLPFDSPTQPRWNHSVEQLELSQPIISPYASFLQMHQGLSLPSTAPPPPAAIAARSPLSPPTSATAPEEEEEEGAPAPFPDAPLPPPAAFELAPLLDDEEDDAEFFDPPLAAPLGALRVGGAAAA